MTVRALFRIFSVSHEGVGHFWDSVGLSSIRAFCKSRPVNGLACPPDLGIVPQEKCLGHVNGGTLSAVISDRKSGRHLKHIFEVA